MPLFFVLSGAVFGLKPIKSFDAICKAKIYRLLFPYYTTGLLFMLPVKYLGCFYTKETILPAIRAFWLGGESGHLWFLLALFWCIIGFSIIIKVLHRLKRAAKLKFLEVEVSKTNTPFVCVFKTLP